MTTRASSAAGQVPVHSSAYTWTLEALTPVWTGDADRQGNRLITTGLLGSIRWWFEALVRGLGGSACDPSDSSSRCPHEAGRRCVACELFGCTGWARKFRFQVLGQDGQTLSSAVGANTEFRLRFVPLRPVAPEEWGLLDATLRLIAHYGAIGGRTVWKPSDEPSRQGAQHHRDYGLIKLVEGPAQLYDVRRHSIEVYVRQPRWRKVGRGDFAWASLETFWCVSGRYVARQNTNNSTFNRVVGRREPKHQAQQLASNDDMSKWLAGRQRESKKIFSFKKPARTFGFVKPVVIGLDQMKKRLRDVWPDLKDEEIVTGDEILGRLMQGPSGGTR